jgi:hypothetical protein
METFNKLFGSLLAFVGSEEAHRVAPALASVRRSVGSRTGAVFRRCRLSVAPRFLWECLTSRTVNPFPVPATSNPACEFLALGFPVHFLPRVM